MLEKIKLAWGGFLLLLIFLGGAGWVLNLFALFSCDFEGPWKSEILRGVGVFIAPIGAVAGWFNF
tara:strand:+ start:1009 stop:1203 length:195 start_codon:yes stop_codon:yes gene_type:complete